MVYFELERAETERYFEARGRGETIEMYNGLVKQAIREGRPISIEDKVLDYYVSLEGNGKLVVRIRR